MDASPPPPSTDSLATADHFIYVTQVYFCDAVVLWDWIISLPREYRFVWRTRWTPVKLAYLFCRYWVITVVPYLLYCFVVDHSRETCERIFRIPVALAMWNQVGSEFVLLIRTYAFFSRNVYVLMLLLSALSGVVAYQLYVDTTQMLLLPFFKPPFDKGPCLPMFQAPLRSFAWLLCCPLLFDTVVTFMTVWKAFHIRRRNGGPNSRLIQTFLREGVFYYILISIANLINGIFYLQPRQVISAINIPLSVMLGPVLACRLILDLRERGSKTVAHSDSTGIAAFTTKSGGSQWLAVYASRMRRSSGVVLTTLGTIPPNHLDFEQDGLEMDDIRIGVDLEILSTAVGGPNGEPVSDSESQEGSPAPAYATFENGPPATSQHMHDLPDLEALAKASPALAALTSDPILHRYRLKVVSPSRVQHGLFATGPQGVALRPTVGDLVQRGVIRGLNIERRWRMGTYIYSFNSIIQYENSLALARRHAGHVLTIQLRRRLTETSPSKPSGTNPLNLLFSAHIIPHVEYSKPTIARSLMPTVHKLKWSIQRDSLAKLIKARFYNKAGLFGNWVEKEGRGVVKEDEKVRLAICPGIRTRVGFFEALSRS
ncbi:hypothetical protein NMY22_g15794 [Coprinellus aureogranulatus]|nr:hypothetical protein NMY22_g15794 [Coprinellus aureogranulatus]